MHLEMQRASGVAMAAEVLVAQGHTVTPEQLTPNYLRLSQAERERLARLQTSDQFKLKGDS